MKLYHYTDANAVKSMLETGRLWLSDIRYMNDHSEYKEGESIISATFSKRAGALLPDEAKKISDNLESTFNSSKSSYTFICSLSRGEDLLSQWRGYCPKTGGYSLEFEIDAHKDFGAPLHDCVYDSKTKQEAADSLYELAQKVILEKGNKSKLFQTTWANIAKFKNAGFVEESEVRVIIFKRQDDAAIKFRTRESLIVPYIEIDLPFDKLKSVWVGPCPNPDLAKDSLSRLIDKLAMNKNHHFSKQKPTVKCSSITYRG
ncbi:hypothetical protein D3C78_726900 [compost metagenome]